MYVVGTARKPVEVLNEIHVLLFWIKILPTTLKAQEIPEEKMLRINPYSSGFILQVEYSLYIVH